MQLDELEKLAKNQLAPHMFNVSRNQAEIARGLLKLIAVVRATQTWKQIVITKGSETTYVGNAEQSVFVALAALEEVIP